MAAPEFWNDSEAAQKVVTELNALRRIYEPYRDLERERKDGERLSGPSTGWSDSRPTTQITAGTPRSLPCSSPRWRRGTAICRFRRVTCASTPIARAGRAGST